MSKKIVEKVYVYFGNRKIFYKLFLSLLLVSTVIGHTQLNYHQELDSALIEADQKKKFIFLEFFADWCPPCNQLHKEILDTPEGKKFLEPFVFVRIDTDNLERWNYKGFQTTNIPTVFILDSKGRELTRITGYDTKEDFRDLLKGFLDGRRIPKILQEKIKSQPENMDLRDQLFVFYLTTNKFRKAKKVLEGVKRLSSSEA